MKCSQHNLFSLHYHSISFVKHNIKNLIISIINADSNLSKHPKIIRAYPNTYTINLMIRFGIIDTKQNIRIVKKHIGNYMFLRLVVALNLLKHINYQYIPNIMKFSYKQNYSND